MPVAVYVLAGAVPPTVLAKKLTISVPPEVRTALAGTNDGVMFVVEQQESAPWFVIATVSVTVPAKFPRLPTLSEATTAPPLMIDREFGTAAMLKS